MQGAEENAKILSSWTGGKQAVAQLFSYLNQLHIIGAGLVDATECCPVVGHIVGQYPELTSWLFKAADFPECSSLAICSMLCMPCVMTSQQPVVVTACVSVAVRFTFPAAKDKSSCRSLQYIHFSDKPAPQETYRSIVIEHKGHLSGQPLPYAPASPSF